MILAPARTPTATPCGSTPATDATCSLAAMAAKAAIAANEHVASVAGVDPQGVAVGVRAGAKIIRGGQPAVLRWELRVAEHVRQVGVLRLDTARGERHLLR